MPRRIVAHRLIVSLLIAGTVVLPHAIAQDALDAPIADAHMEIVAGDVFEIFGVTTTPDGHFDWVLTTQGNFVEAGREKIYRTRLTQPGTYAIDGQMESATGNKRVHLTLEVRPRDPNAQPENPDESPGIDIVTTDIGAPNGTVQLPPGSPFLTMTPSPALSSPIALDLDIRRDSNGDNNPANDNDAADTLFTTEHNPLHLWFTAPESAAPIHLTTVAQDGTTLDQDLTIEAGTAAAPFQSISVGDERQGSVGFSIALDPTIDPASIVTTWDFGDGFQSLNDEPVHKYRNNGSYSVHVLVREMASGRELAQGNTSVTIVSAPIQQVSSRSSAASAASSVQSTENSSAGTSSGGSFLGTIFKLFLLLIVAGALGAAGVFGSRKFLHRESSLQKALEEAEGKLLKKDKSSTGPIDVAPVTLALKREEKPAPAKEESIEEAIETAKVTEPPAPPAAPSAAPAAPAWLEKGLAASTEKIPAPPPTEDLPPPLPTEPPAPSPLPTPPPPAAPIVTDLPLSAPLPVSPTAPVTPSAEPTAPAPSAPSPALSPEAVAELSEDDLLPPWLKEEATNGTDTMTPATPPPPIPTPESAAPTPLPTPVPSEPSAAPIGPAVAETPAWLNPAPEPSPIPTTTGDRDNRPDAPLPPPAPTAVLPEPVAPIAAVTPPPPPPTLTPTPPPPPAIPTTPPSPPPALDPNLQAKLEHEQERKRRKRQRYRENLKKRKEATAVADVPAQTPAPVPPPMTLAATNPNPAPAKITSPKPVASLPPPTVKALNAPKAKPVAPPQSPSPKPAPQKSSSPNPPAQKNVPQKKSQNPPKNPQTTTPDSTVAFVIKAEGVEGKNKKSEQSNKQKKQLPPAKEV